MLTTFPNHLENDNDAVTAQGEVTVRGASSGDAEALQRLAELEGREAGAQPHLLAEHEGAVIASLSLVDGIALGDPFRPTADVVDLLRAHAERTGRSPVGRSRPGRGRRLLAGAAGVVAVLSLAATAGASAPTVTIGGTPAAINPTTKGFNVSVRCTSTDADCVGVLDVQTAGRIKPYSSSPAAVARVGTFPFRVPAGASGTVRGRVYGPALAQAMLRGRVVLRLTPRQVGVEALGAPRNVVFTYKRA